MTDGWTGGRDAFGDFAPGMVHYTDRVLFDEVWEREGLSKRDRSLVTVAALTALGKTDQVRFHLAYARDNGAQGDRRGVGQADLGTRTLARGRALARGYEIPRRLGNSIAPRRFHRR